MESLNIVEKGTENEAFWKAVFSPNILGRERFFTIGENNGNLNQADPEFIKLLKEPRNRFQGINSVRLCSLTGR
jgi:hypothetical protein